jgi:hypothetical protein
LTYPFLAESRHIPKDPTSNCTPLVSQLQAAVANQSREKREWMQSEVAERDRDAWIDIFVVKPR